MCLLLSVPACLPATLTPPQPGASTPRDRGAHTECWEAALSLEEPGLVPHGK